MKNLKITFAIKEKNVMKLLKVTFQKSQKLLAENLRERPPIQNISITAIHSISKAGYCNRRTGYILSVYELRAREASSFCDFWNMTSCDFTLFYSFFTQANVIFLDVLGKEYFC